SAGAEEESQNGTAVCESKSLRAESLVLLWEQCNRHAPRVKRLPLIFSPKSLNPCTMRFCLSIMAILAVMAILAMADSSALPDGERAAIARRGLKLCGTPSARRGHTDLQQLPVKFVDAQLRLSFM